MNPSKVCMILLHSNGMCKSCYINRSIYIKSIFNIFLLNYILMHKCQTVQHLNVIPGFYHLQCHYSNKLHVFKVLSVILILKVTDNFLYRSARAPQNKAAIHRHIVLVIRPKKINSLSQSSRVI